jgi:hydrogenase maturation protease
LSDTSNNPVRVGVVGLGNVLMGDDAFGPYVIQVLEAAYALPSNVSARDLGTPSLDLTGYIEDFDVLIVVDTVHSVGEPGEIRRYTRDQLLKRPVQPRTSPHEPGLKEALLIAEFHGRGPSEVLLVGVIPETTSTGIGLSARVRAAIAPAAEEILSELARLGFEAAPLASPRLPQVWWEEAAHAV